MTESTPGLAVLDVYCCSLTSDPDGLGELIVGVAGSDGGSDGGPEVGSE